jgi:hypothetical protein
MPASATLQHLTNELAYAVELARQHEALTTLIGGWKPHDGTVVDGVQRIQARLREVTAENTQLRAKARRLEELGINEDAAAGAHAELNRLRAEVADFRAVEPLPVLPDVGPVGQNPSGVVWVGEYEDRAWYHSRAHVLNCLAHAVAGLREFDRLDAEAAATANVGKQFVITDRPTYCGHPITREHASQGMIVTFVRERELDGHRVAFVDLASGGSLSIDVDSLRPHEVVEADTTNPDDEAGVPLLEDEDGAPFPDEVQRAHRMVVLDERRAARTSEETRA